MMTRVGRLFYVTGPSGVGVRQALDKYCSYLEKIGRNDEVPVILQLESELFYELAAVPVAAVFPEISGDPNLYDILRLPKTTLCELWSKVFESKIAEAWALRQTGRDVVITFHAIWYHHQNREFISGVDFDRLSQSDARAEAVITLIDDIFDVLVRLSKEDGVFSIQHFPNPVVDQTEKLLRILDWRAHEQLLSEKIASVAAKDLHFLLAVKHPISTLRQLLHDPASTKIYLSHPISAPRTMLETSEKGEAERDIASIQGMSKALRDCAILFEPTSIDELRFRSHNGTTLPSLTRRWPLTASKDELLWDPCDAAEEFGIQWGDEVSAALAGNAVALNALDTSRAIVEILTDAIARHINLRDHKLVDQADFLVVYRPYYKGKVSSGVEEELSYYARLRTLGAKTKPCIVLHPPEDEQARPIVAAEEYVRGAAFEQRDRLQRQRLVAGAEEVARDLISEDDLVVGRALRRIASTSGVTLRSGTSLSALRADPASQVQQQDRVAGREFREMTSTYISTLPAGTANVIGESLAAEVFATRVCELITRKESTE